MQMPNISIFNHYVDERENACINDVVVGKYTTDGKWDGNIFHHSESRDVKKCVQESREGMGTAGQTAGREKPAKHLTGEGKIFRMGPRCRKSRQYRRREQRPTWTGGREAAVESGIHV